MKNKALLFILLTVVLELFYQLGYKFAPSSINPIAVISAIYICCFILTLITSIIFEKTSKQQHQKLFFKNKGIYFFALAVAGLDFGHLLIYRFLTDASKVFILSTPFQSLALVLTGALVFGEKLNKKTILEIALSLTGIILISL